MCERKTDDARIQSILRSSFDESLITEVTSDWSVADFQYALQRVQIDTPGLQKVHFSSLLQKLRDERKTADIHLTAERANEARHNELIRKVEDLKKPHWSVTPNFWVTLIILILTAIGATAAVLALFR